MRCVCARTPTSSPSTTTSEAVAHVGSSRRAWIVQPLTGEVGGCTICASRLRSFGAGGDTGAETARLRQDQYSPLITKYEPRIVPASFDFCLANLNDSSSAGISIPSESLKPTARFGLGPSMVYITLMDRPLS